MVKLSLFFKINHPLKLNRYRIYDIGQNQEYFRETDYINQIQELSKNNYSKNNDLMFDMLKKYNNNFNFSIYINGLTLKYICKYCPSLTKQLKELSNMKNVEFIIGTYSYCLSFLYSKQTFKEQIQKDIDELKNSFPNASFTTFKNTLLLYNNDMEDILEELNIKNVLIENSIQNLKQNPNYVYYSKNQKLKLFIKNNEIEKEFQNSLKTGNYNKLIKTISEQKADIINITSNYNNLENFENFLELATKNNIEFTTPTQFNGEVKDKIDIPTKKQNNNYQHKINPITQYNENILQTSSIEELIKLKALISQTKDEKIHDSWYKLLNSFHLNTMNTGNKILNSQNHQTPYDSYIYFMNVINDITNRITKNQACKSINYN